MYLVHIGGVIFFQNLRIPSFNSATVLGRIRLWRYSLRVPQTFSIGFRSGLEAGVRNQLIFFSSKYAFVHLLVCLGSLSCWNLCVLLPNWEFRKGRSAASKMSVYLVAVKVPVNITIAVAPFFEIPPQMLTLGGCFGRPVSLAG